MECLPRSRSFGDQVIVGDPLLVDLRKVYPPGEVEAGLRHVGEGKCVWPSRRRLVLGWDALDTIISIIVVSGATVEVS